jgi:hypothetical protein
MQEGQMETGKEKRWTARRNFAMYENPKNIVRFRNTIAEAILRNIETTEEH